MALKNSIESGSYKPDYNEVAMAIIQYVQSDG